MKPQSNWILTANDLLMGDVIYLSNSNTWTRTLNEAQVFVDEETANDALHVAGKDISLLEPYLAKVNASSGTPDPAHFREDFRATGPSNYHHGKQEHINV